MVELLVVILIVGILAAIAIPVFLNQTGKAYDVAAKSQARAAQTAIEAYAADHNGDYTNATKADLVSIEPTLADTGGAVLAAPSGLSSTGYTLTSTANGTGDQFSITVDNGVVHRSCTPGSGVGHPGGCPQGGNW
jgi:type II secretory pathway pseudopilin PulG